MIEHSKIADHGSRLVELAQALVLANQKANPQLAVSIPDKVKKTAEPEIGQVLVVFAAAAKDASPLRPLPVEGKYYDSDGHIVFLSGYFAENGDLAEFEVARLDLVPLQRIPDVAEIAFEPGQSGYYNTVKPQSG